MVTLPKSVTLFSCGGCEQLSVVGDLHEDDNNRTRCRKCGTIAGVGGIEIYRRDEE